MAADPIDTYDVVIVGAGFAGLHSLYKMREIGCSAHVFEAGDGVGGAWHWNTYPGARCDVPSHDYSFAFSEELQQEWEWTEKYPAQSEINAYFNHVADRFDMRKDISLSSRVTSAHYDEADRLWDVETDNGLRARARYLVMASGTLSIRKDPRVEFDGIEAFRGEWYLSSDYPTDGVDYRGKRTLIIGTGSSGVQMIPVVAQQAAHLTVLQRRPAFSIPAWNGPIDPEFARALKARYSEHRAKARASAFGVNFPNPTHSVLEVDPAVVAEDLHQRWSEGGITNFMSSYTDVLLDVEANEVLAEFIRDRIRETVHDPRTAELLCPTDYAFGTKRPTMDTNYYQTYNRDNVSLVSLLENPIDRFTETGVRLADGSEIEADVIVFATGFDAMTGALLAVDFRGRGGRTLREDWAQGPRAYLGLAVHDFPNVFTLMGPGSVSVLSNNVVAIEQHVEWVADAIVGLRERGLDTIEATEDAQDAWMEHVAEVGSYTLFPQGNSWYLGSNVKGKPQGLMIYVGGLDVYRKKCDDVAAAGYEGFELSGAPALV